MDIRYSVVFTCISNCDLYCILIEIVVERNTMYKRFGLSKSCGIGAGSKQ